MNKLRALIARIGGLFGKGRSDREFAEEIESHVQMHMDDNVRAGMTPEEARRQALIKFGGIEGTKEAYRDQRGIPWLETFWQNLRFGARQLRKNPGFTAMAVPTLALGIGSTTAIFSVVYATLFEPLPYPKPHQLVMVWSQVKGARNSVSAGDYMEWMRRSTSFQYLEAWTGGTFYVGTPERPEQAQAALMRPDFFRMTGSPMFIGRDFLPEEGEIGKDHVVIMTHRAWSQYFGSDRDILGKQIRMNGEPYTVIGVTPPGMRDRQSSQFMLPLAFKPDMLNHQSHFLRVMGRLKDGVSVRQADAEMKIIAKQLATEFPQTNPNWDISVEPLQNDFIPPTTIRNLWLLMGAVSFLLLIACVNIANLLLARATVRQREVAIRAALGATRGQLFGQFLTESLLLSLIGGALGVYLSRWIIDGILGILPAQMLPSEADVRLSVPVLVFTVLASVLTGLLFGSMPAWKASDLDLSEELNQGGRSGLAHGGRGLRRALVVVEFALALTLLATGGLALRSFWNLTRIDLGIRTDHILTFFLPVPDGRFPQAERIAPYYHQMLEKIRSVPGVQSAAFSTSIPLLGFSTRTFRIAGAPPPADPGARPDGGFQLVTPGFFDTFGIRVVQGRHFTEQDGANAIRVAMINETFAKRYFPNQDPVGQRIVMNDIVFRSQQPGPEVDWQIVGVFHDTRAGDLRGDHVPALIVPFWQSPVPRAAVVVRTASEPREVTRSLISAINSVDPDLPLAGIKTMDQILNETLSFDRFGTVLFGSFAGLALLLAGLGIYGVMSFGVAQRTHEFGIRMSLGASDGEILLSVLREGLYLALLGLVLGLGGAYFVGRTMQSGLYGVAALDPAAFGTVGFVLLAAALLACYLPARRASRVDPMVALRYD